LKGGESNGKEKKESSQAKDRKALHQEKGWQKEGR